MFDEMAKMVQAHHTTLNLKLQPNIIQISEVENETVMFRKATKTLTSLPYFGVKLSCVSPLFSLLIAAPLLAGVQNFAGVTQQLRSTPGTDSLDSYVGLIALVLLTSALVDH